MYRAYVAGAHDFESWRQAARPFILARIAPQNIDWAIGEGQADISLPPPSPGHNISIPKAFFDLARVVSRRVV